MSSPLTPAHSLIQALYHSYRHSPTSTQGVYFSPTCLQICRPIPSYSATTRAQIVQYLKEATAAKVKDAAGETSDSAETNEIQGVYTIRPLHPDEALDFSTPEVTSPIHLTPDELRAKAKNEGWVGMRVDLWDHGAPVEGSMLVKVQYWWRWEDVASEERLEGDVDGKGWRQCLHDIMYIGPKDGSEGEEGLEVMDCYGKAPIVANICKPDEHVKRHVIWNDEERILKRSASSLIFIQVASGWNRTRAQEPPYLRR